MKIIFSWCPSCSFRSLSVSATAEYQAASIFVSKSLLSCGQALRAAVGWFSFRLWTLVCVWMSSITTDEAQPRTIAKILISFKNDMSVL